MRPGAIVLAGGKSSRMGEDKAFAELGGRPLLQWVLDALEPWTRRRAVLVVREPERFAAFAHRALVVQDEGDEGPLTGLASGLRHVRGWAFATSCDAPFLQPAFVGALAARTHRVDAVVPGSPEERYPLSALYHRRCLPAMRAALARGDQRLIGFHEGVRVRWVPLEELRGADPGLRSLRNLNTPEELARARAGLTARG